MNTDITVDKVLQSIELAINNCRDICKRSNYTNQETEQYIHNNLRNIVNKILDCRKEIEIY